MRKNDLILIIFFILSILTYGQEWQSNIVYYDNNENLVYQSDSEGNKIPDFSYAGYKSDGLSIPSTIPVVKTISPIAGDNTSQI